MRREKDARHSDLENDFESHRRSTTETINSHSENITMLESIKTTLHSKILGHESLLHQKRDVEDHHAMSKEQIREHIEAKGNL